MNKFLGFLTIALVSSCASIDAINKSPNCTVWRDQKYWGPYSIEVVGNTVKWDAMCKAYNSGCIPLTLKLDENKNILSDEVIIGKIENNEAKMIDNHIHAKMLSYKIMRASLQNKSLSTLVDEQATPVEVYKLNDKCTTESALVGGVALDLIQYLQKH